MARNNTPSAGPTKRVHGQKLMTIHPVIAAKWLEKNRRNRKIVKAHLERLKRIIDADEWAVTGESVKFDANGDLMDGQHRLLACVETGKPIETWVCFGLEPEVFDKLDQGAVRTTAHILSIDKVKDSRTVAAAVTAIKGIELAIKTGNMPGTVGWQLKERVEAHDARTFVEANQAMLVEAVTTVRGPDARAILRPPSTFTALYFVLAGRNHSRCREFFNLLATGADLPLTSPIHKLRQTLIASIADKSRTAPWKAAITLKTWNHWLRDKPMRQVRFRTNDEKFPKPRARG